MSTATETTTTDAPAPQIPQTDVPSWRLIATLAVAGALAAVLLAVVSDLTRERIAANKAAVLKEAIGVVLHDADRIVSLKENADGLELDEEVVYLNDRIFFGYDADGRPLGFAMVGGAYGYGSDPIRLIFSYDASTREVLGLKVLEHKETPGIGTKIEDDAAFAGQWSKPVGDGTRRRAPRLVAADASLVAVRSDATPATDADVERHEVDTISGATISSKAVIKIVNDRVRQLGEKLSAWNPEEGR